MSKQDAQDFYAKAQEDEALRDKVEEAIRSGAYANAGEAFVAVGKEINYEFTAEEAKDAVVDGVRLSDDELDDVAGGFGKARDCARGPKSCIAFNRACNNFYACTIDFVVTWLGEEW